MYVAFISKLYKLAIMTRTWSNHFSKYLQYRMKSAAVKAAKYVE